MWVATGRLCDLPSVIIPGMLAWRQAGLEIDCRFMSEKATRAITVSVADMTMEDTVLDGMTHFCVACPADKMELAGRALLFVLVLEKTDRNAPTCWPASVGLPSFFRWRT